jgi:hypothetical protein
MEISQKDNTLFLYFEKEAIELFFKIVSGRRSDTALDFSSRACLRVRLKESEKVNDVLNNVLYRLQEAKKLI